MHSTYKMVAIIDSIFDLYAWTLKKLKSVCVAQKYPEIANTEM